MTGWLVYSREGAERNQTFIDFWFQAAKESGVHLEPRYVDEPIPDNKPDFAVVRDMNPHTANRWNYVGLTYLTRLS